MNEKSIAQEGTNRKTKPKKKGPVAKVDTPNADDKTKRSSTARSKTGTDCENENKVAWAKKTHGLSCKALSEEFLKQIKKFRDTRCTTILSAKNEDKNRYADVLCLDNTRVKLKGRKEDDDYIHANWVTNPDGSKVICTQGPLAETIEDFWWMIVKEKVSIILMLCQFFEGAEDNEKCAKYFPVNVEDSLTFGPFTVTNLNVDTDPTLDGCTITSLEVKFEKTKHRLRHVLMTTWPDQCAPLSSASILALYHWQKKEVLKDTPVVVHCSAGVGRTATFAAIDLAIFNIGKNANVSMMEVVKAMRGMRYQAVQSHVQYLFLHLMMLDLFVAQKITPPYKDDSKFIKDYKRMATRKIVKEQKRGVAEAKKGSKEKDGGKKTSMLEDD